MPKGKKIQKEVIETPVKIESKEPKKFCFRFTSSVSIWGNVFQKDTLINLSEEELKIYRPYVICHDETSIQKKPCKRC
jgi:hypothetical protein